jgi:hypothetical protein
VVYMARGVSASCGWYMYAVIIPEILLVTYGLLALAPKRWCWIVLPGMATIFAAIDIYGVHALLAPYYSGLIVHTAGKRCDPSSKAGAVGECWPARAPGSIGGE